MEQKHKASVFWQLTVWLLLTLFFAIPINYFVLSNMENIKSRIPCRVFILFPKG